MPGNHDRALVQPWLRARHMPLTVDAALPPDATPLLAEVTGWLAPARVAVHYPGVWLSGRVWATHGHYLDRHLLPESAYGLARGLLGRKPRDGATPVDYEEAGGPSVTRVEGLLTRWLPRPLAVLADDLAELLRASTMPALPRVPSRRLAPVTSRLLGLQMQRASIPALARVAHRLGIEADWVLFGHVHRSGPLAGRRPRALARPRRDPADRERRRLGLRAGAPAPRAPAAPVLARRGDPPRGRRRPAPGPAPGRARPGRAALSLSPPARARPAPRPSPGPRRGRPCRASARRGRR